MNQSRNTNQPSEPRDIWAAFLAEEQKTDSKLGKIFVEAGFAGYEFKSQTLTLYFSDEDKAKTARSTVEKLKKKLKNQKLFCKNIEFQVGDVRNLNQSPPPKMGAFKKGGNPLQALIFAEFGRDRNNEELVQPVFVEAVKQEGGCQKIYEKLKKRTEQLIGTEGALISASFNWRVRVGGTRGFRESLLPVFHPIFGVPYIPSSSLKGAARAWARKHGSGDRILHLLGMLEGKQAIAAKVEFLDAFPTKPCLSVDVATPQWHWNNNQVTYKPEPHALLSLERPEFLMGLRPTARGTSQEVQEVKTWLENALKTGIGSRVSSGYGRALGQLPQFPHSQSYSFELWTQGMYGSNPPSPGNHYQGTPEFRPTAVRGILRYWFRAMALSLYNPQDCKTLEQKIFGDLSIQGQVSISVLFNPNLKQNPDLYSGSICLEATEPKYLKLLEQLLILASHLGGVGRGSRRPLHYLNKMLRGCYWEVNGQGFPLEANPQKWQQFFEGLKAAFNAVESPLTSHISGPGTPSSRQQDVLDRNVQVWLLKTPKQIHPDRVKNWPTEGVTSPVRGDALDLLYSSTDYKGQNQDRLGNPQVGGKLGTPSFVWIKSIFPREGSAYQVVTIFGANQSDRQKFARALQKEGAVLVFGSLNIAQSSGPNRRR
ncbi:RAMP superfamily CRISPR-associated protein [Oscillatoria sp. HE19RPO]|uniref:RAMP superfamily CRISPR-associated protein n=1 Tax=Oscillatoria sp. HE19RPO TaxID=2954806 RepID=UPI0020C33FAD|nr:RAMP superfamily CRISPR-associated protein [Oscillatoria sp. HE19RPO]